MVSRRRHLPKLLRRGLAVVFCGTAAGTSSSRRRAYYAGAGNKFWAVLAEVGLTRGRLAPEAYPRLLESRLGLTDLVAHKAGMDRGLAAADFDVSELSRDVRRFRPRILAFNGKLAASVFLGVPTGEIAYGEWPGVVFPATRVFVLPSTSGAACRSWSVRPWRRLAREAAAA